FEVIAAGKHADFYSGSGQAIEVKRLVNLVGNHALRSHAAGAFHESDRRLALAPSGQLCGHAFRGPADEISRTARDDIVRHHRHGFANVAYFLQLSESFHRIKGNDGS